ncbi:hypothetical protein GCM10022223_17040 [Kineosporia mesophila]|uniref:Multidrug efflux pump Tap n=1 Tax=Kineosporia mesophila TaxID=566012 RepID=A0ABP6ZCC7_9ACTN|nr:MFS transporter [Kineosporia mesophila]MCD5352057.1 MFS transporter [Kineosporia mesophila]
MPRVVLAYLGSYFLSVLGNSIAAVALPLVILQSTGSPLKAGVVAAATAVPAVLAGLFMGTVIDRINRRTSSIVTDLVSAATTAALPLVALTTDLTVGWFILFGVLGSLGDVPGLTAREALLPAISRNSGMTPERLVGLRESLGALCIVIGPAAAAGALTFFDGPTVLWVTAATSLAAALVTLLIPGTLTTVEAPGPGTGIRAGWKALFSSPFLVTTTALICLSAVVLAALQGLVLPVHFTSTGRPNQLGLVLTTLALGLLLGSGLYALAARTRSRRFWLVTGMAGTVVGFAVTATLLSTVVILTGAFLIGFSSGLFASLLGVLSMERIDDDLRGRVMGTQNALMTGAPALGIMGAAVLTEKAGVEVAAATLASIWALGALTAVLVPATRDLDPPTSTPTVTGASIR